MLFSLRNKKNLVAYLMIFLVLIPILGLNFFVSFLGNILLLLFLIPILIVIIILLSFNSIKSKLNVCSQCGSISLGLSDTCMNCGANLENSNNDKNELNDNPSERTIEVKAEEIK